MKRFGWYAFFLVVAGGGGTYWYFQHQAGQKFTFRTTTVERRPFLAGVAASGTLLPVEVIDVSSEVAGRIESLGLDPRYEISRKNLLHSDILLGLTLLPHPALTGILPVKLIDNRSPVEPDSILAQIDPRQFEIRVKKAQADLARAQADLELAEAKMTKATEDWKRAKDLYRTKAIADAEFDRYKEAFEEAHAKVKQFEAAIHQQSPLLEEALYHLEKTVIRSKVKGIVLDRRVNVGQTVVANLNPTSMFLIATDLTRMKIQASVNEVDIPNIYPGQEVRFTLDGIPFEEFLGLVPDDQPSYNVTFTSNVVTYPVLVYVDNSDLLLKPYQTVNVRFVQARKDNALVVPNGALRWRPSLGQVSPEYREKFHDSIRQRKTAQQERDEAFRRTVWFEEDGHVRPLEIQVGYSDGSFTEVVSSNLPEGAAVVIGEEAKQEAGSTPFAPNMMGSKKPRD